VIKIRKAIEADKDEIWNIIQEVISTGDTYLFSPDSSKEKMLDYWFKDGKHTYVASDDDKVVGTFIITQNQPDLGSHIANASYMTSPGSRGKGIGKRMGEYSLKEAKKLGFSAMQFNIVVKSNEGAVRLWKSLGFEIIGEIPDAFNHKQNGLTNAYIMYRKV
jgi:ribosomal protein S18 acetylase RimI-like enzyme